MNESFFWLPEKKQQAIFLCQLPGVFENSHKHTGAARSRKQPPEDVSEYMLRQRKVTAERNYGQGEICADEMEKDFMHMVAFWISIYLRKEG